MSGVTMAGSVQGAYAEKFPEFAYREAIPQEITPFTLDPGRVFPDREFPRWSTRITPPAQKVVTLCDFRIEVDDINGLPCHRQVHLWLVPSRYSAARSERKAASFGVSYAVPLSTIHDEALNRAFGAAKP